MSNLSIDEVKRTAAEWGRPIADHEWAVERARHYVQRRQARLRFGFACALLMSLLMWVALIEGGLWLWRHGLVLVMG